jgi:predicted XRE-type DNA-binding protein
MESQSFACVWDALESTPEAAAEMRARSDLLIALQDKVASWGVTQAEAAHRLGIGRDRLDDLMRGRFSKFSLIQLAELERTAEDGG